MAASNVLAASFLILFLSSLIKLLEAQMVPAMFVFGDSLVDVGNNNYLKLSLAKADFPHNGVDFPTKKPTGRFTNGKNAADFLGTYVN
jgi:phospholipase/lecithinase/hemolysin